MKKIRENSRLIWLTLFILISMIFSILMIFNINKNRINSNINQYINSYLTDVMSENVNKINMRIDETFTSLEIIATSLGNYQNEEVIDIKNILEKQKKNIGVTKLDILSKDGNSINGKEYKNIIKDKYIKQSLNGVNTISNVVISEKTKNKEIIFSVPIIGDKGGIVGVLLGIYEIHDFANILGTSVFNGKADTFILQKDGNLLSKPDTVSATNLYTLLKTANNGKEDITIKLRNSIEIGDTGFLTMGLDKYKRYVCYNKLKENDWCLVTIMSHNLVEQNVLKVVDISLDTGKAIIFFSLIITIYMFGIYQYSNSKTKLSARKYKICAEQSNSVIFEYDYNSKQCLLNDKWLELYGDNIIIDNFIEEICKNGIVYEDDIDILESAFLKVSENKQSIKKEIRLRDNKNNLIWNSLTITPLQIKKEKIIKIIGKCTDINKEKNAIEYFKQQSEIDLATGLYNKETTNKKIKNSILQIENDLIGALLYIDVDNFKEINDNYGHNFGDHVIRQVANILKDETRDNSFAGRVGGDEFIFVIDNIKNTNIAMKTATKIINKSLELKFPHHNGVKISVSIGIATIPNDGNTPKDLIKTADIAMFNAKQKGKQCAVLGVIDKSE